MIVKGNGSNNEVDDGINENYNGNDYSVLLKPIQHRDRHTYRYMNVKKGKVTTNVPTVGVIDVEHFKSFYYTCHYFK